MPLAAVMRFLQMSLERLAFPVLSLLLGSKQLSARPEVAAIEEAEEEKVSSWTLDNTTEVVYIATQLQLTKRIQDACRALKEGDANAIDVRLSRGHL